MSQLGLQPNSRSAFTSMEAESQTGLPPVTQIADEFGRAVVIDKVRNCDGSFTLTVSSFIDRYAEAVTRLRGISNIWITAEWCQWWLCGGRAFRWVHCPTKETPNNRVHVSDARALDILADSVHAFSLLRLLSHRR